MLNNQRSHSTPSVTLEPLDEGHPDPPSTVENLSDDERPNPTTVIITSPSSNFDFSSEQNDSLESSEASFLQTNIRRIDHRRNRSEPVKSNSTEDLLSSTNTDSSISNNAHNETRRKSSTKTKQIIEEKSPPSSVTTSRKKKAWYNVSALYCCYLCVLHALELYIYIYFSFNASMSQLLCKRMITFFVLLHASIHEKGEKRWVDSIEN